MAAVEGMANLDIEDESVNEDEDHREFDYYNRPGPSRHPREESYEDDEVQGVDGAADEVQPFDDDTCGFSLQFPFHYY